MTSVVMTGSVEQPLGEDLDRRVSTALSQYGYAKSVIIHGRGNVAVLRQTKRLCRTVS